jgi:Zn-dependent peptidase ImmA (M78 family)
VSRALGRSRRGATTAGPEPGRPSARLLLSSKGEPVAEYSVPTSAVTVFAGTRRAIVHNDRHSLGRQASDLAHELAHGLLLHPPTPARDDRGCQYWNKEIEEEANWLAGCILIPEDAALWIVREGISTEEAATHFSVSTKMVTFRVNVTGARTRVARARGPRSV